MGHQGSWSCSLPLFDPAPLPNPQEISQQPSSRGERRVKLFLEKLFRKPFRKQRPDFLSNPVTGGTFNLELDCYNDELEVAVEFNGRQHYEYVPFFHKNKEAFLNQKYRDEMKRRKCYDRGILLIEVPYTEENRLEEYILERLRRYERLRGHFIDISIDM
jgi:hypothetical protein